MKGKILFFHVLMLCGKKQVGLQKISNGETMLITLLNKVNKIVEQS